MNSQAAILTVHPPIPCKQLGYYRNRKGIFIVRIGDEVLYIGNSTNICKAALRIFNKGGVLAAYNVNRANFEIIMSRLRRPSVQTVLKHQFSPANNYTKKRKEEPSDYEKKQSERIRIAYFQQSRFAPQGEGKTDSLTT